MNPFFRTGRNLTLAVLSLAAVAAPAFAEDTAAIVDRAVNAYNQGIDAENAGRYAEACTSYRDAADGFESAIYSLMSQPMQTEDERENIKAYAAHLQENVDAAKANANGVCNK